MSDENLDTDFDENGDFEFSQFDTEEEESAIGGDDLLDMLDNEENDPANEPSESDSVQNMSSEEEDEYALNAISDLVNQIDAEIDNPSEDDIPAENLPQASEGANAVSPVSKVDLSDADIQRNYTTLGEIELDLSVEVGKMRMKVSDILLLGQGSVIELDKLVGEDVDVLLNGNKIAAADIILNHNHFGTKIKRILPLKERLMQLIKVNNKKGSG